MPKALFEIIRIEETIGFKAIGDEKDEELKRNQDREERIAVLRR